MSLASRPLERRAVVKGLGLGALAVSLGSLSLGCDNQTEPKTGSVGLLDQTFKVRDQFRPFELVSPGFEQFKTQRPTVLRGVTATDQTLVAPFAAIELSVESIEGAELIAGLFTEDGDSVAVVFAADGGQVSVELRQEGRTEVVAAENTKLESPFKAAFAVCENQVTALVDTGDGWQPIVTERDGVSALVDLRVPATLAGFTLGYGARGSGGEVRLSSAKGGPFGLVGVRDPHLVQTPDGQPYIRDGAAYLTFTCAGLGFFQQAHWGVFTLDLHQPPQLVQVAHLYTRRDGLLLGDHAGQIIVDEPEGRFIALNSSWGDFDGQGVHARHTSTPDNLLSGVHLLETEPLDLPTKVSSWDPGATRIDDAWHIAFVESPSQDPFDFHPALAMGEVGAEYDTGLSLMGADTARHQCEGPILQLDDDGWRLLASDGDSKEYPVYDLTMKQVGTLDAPYPTNIPHPQLLSPGDGSYEMVTFNGTQYAEDVLGYGGHGDVVIMSTAPPVGGPG